MPDFAAVIRVWNRPRGLDDVLARFLRCAFWNAASVGLSRLLNVLAMLTTASILGPAGYGRLGVIQSTVAMLGAFAGFGLGITATRFVANCRRTDPVRAAEIISGLQGISLVGGFCVAMIAAVGGPWLAADVFSSVELGAVLQLASILVLLNALQGVQQGAFAGLEAVRSAALIQGLGGVLLLIGMPCGAAWGGVQGCVLAQVAALTVQVAAAQIGLHRVAAESSIHLGLPRPTKVLTELLGFGLPAALSAMMVMPVEWMASVMLVNQPGGFAQMGLYSASWQWITPALMIPAVVGQTVLPLLGERQSAGDRAAPGRLLLAAILVNAAAILPLAGLGLIFSSSLLGVSGPGFLQGEAALRLLILAAVAYAVEAPAGLLLAGQGWIWSAFVANLGWAICLLVAVSCLVHYGAAGVAAARVLAYLIHGVWTFALARKLLRTYHHHVAV